MKVSTTLKTTRHTSLTLILGVLMMLGGCSDNLSTSQSDSNKNSTINKNTSAVNSRSAIDLEVTARHDHDNNEHIFELSTKSLSAGWSTIKFNNASHVDHFILIYKVPQEAIISAESANESILQHWYNGVTVPFQEEFNPYINGEISYGDFVNNLIGTISNKAPWFLDPGAVTMGGPGVTSAGLSSTTTINLQPGTYVVECYVKDENQEFHSYNGMLDILEVTEIKTEEAEPKTTMEVSITQDGLEIPQNIRPGLHTVGITFGEQPQFGYEHLLGHNAHLVRLEQGYDQSLLGELSAWMDWTSPNGLINQSPEGSTFLGGSMEMTAGYTSYFSVWLTPGDYAWIAEVPNPDEKNMLKTFTVPSQKSKDTATPLRYK